MNFKMLDIYLARFGISKEALSQFIRYIIVGFTTFFVEYSIFYSLMDIVFVRYPILNYGFLDSIAYSIFHIHYDNTTYNYLAANTVAYIIVFWFNFLMNRHWSFKSKTDLSRQLKLYACLFLLNLAFTNVALHALVEYVKIIPEIAKVLVMGGIVMWNFVIYRKIIYR